MYDMMSPDQRAEFDAENRRVVAEFNNLGKRAEIFAELDKKVNQLDKEVDLRIDEDRTKQRGFWAEDDPDEFAQVEDGDEEINDDEITSMAHAEMELHREAREYARIAAWDMPMLSSKFGNRPLNVSKYLTQTFSYRTGKALYTASRHTHPPLPLYYIHGRAAPS